MRAPLFWKEKAGISNMLFPFSVLYGWGAGVLAARKFPAKFPAHVICVGNLVAGGAGKTPIALALGKLLKRQGRNAHFLSRGYRSDNKGVTRVDPGRHSAAEVGDEPLLLAEILPTWVCADRAMGAQAAIAAGAEVIIMDDGFQNRSIAKDVSLLVVDGRYGFGNERLLPAGPLREPIAEGMRRATAIVMIGEDAQHVLRHAPAGMKVLKAHVKPEGDFAFLRGKQVVAFCGIASPRKFYRTLQQIGCDIQKYVAYPDHYRYQEADLRFLREKAAELDAALVTTAKDYVRLPPDMRGQVHPVPVEAVFDDESTLLETVMARP